MFRLDVKRRNCKHANNCVDTVMLGRAYKLSLPSRNCSIV